MKTRGKPDSKKGGKIGKSSGQNKELSQQSAQQESGSGDQISEAQEDLGQVNVDQREVYKIHAKRTRKGQQVQYKVQYAGDKALEWQFLSNLRHAIDKIQEYQQRNGSDKKIFKTIQQKLTSYLSKKNDGQAGQGQKIDQSQKQTRKVSTSVKNQESQDKQSNKKQTMKNKKKKSQQKDQTLNKLREKLLQKKAEVKTKIKQKSQSQDKESVRKSRRIRKQSEQAKKSQNSSSNQDDLGSRQNSKHSGSISKNSKPNKRVKVNQQQVKEEIRKQKSTVSIAENNKKKVMAIKINSSQEQADQQNNKDVDKSTSSKAGGILNRISRDQSEKPQKQKIKAKKDPSQKSLKKKIAKQSDNSNEMADSKSARISVLQNVNKQQPQVNEKNKILTKYKVLKVFCYSINKKQYNDRKQVKYKVEIELPNKVKEERIIIKEQFETSCLSKLNQFLIEKFQRCTFIKRNN